MNVSCGIVLYSDSKVLLCHATSKSRLINIGDKRWGIPKGLLDEGEELLQAALRELYEETGIDYKNFDLDISPYREYTFKDKLVVTFRANDDSGEARDMDCFCESTVPIHGYPEVDSFVWMRPQEALDVVTDSQRCLFENWI